MPTSPAGSWLARSLPLPAPVALAVFNKFPGLQRSLISNEFIPFHTWSSLPLECIQTDIAVLLLRYGSVDLLRMLLRSEKVDSTVARHALSTFHLPEDMMAHLVLHLDPEDVTSVLSSNFPTLPTNLLSRILKVADPSWAFVQWLSAHPIDVDDDTWVSALLRVKFSTIENVFPSVSVVGQRPHLASRLVREDPRSYWLPIWAIVADTTELSAVVDEIVVRSTNGLDRTHAQVAAAMLMSRFDMSDELLTKAAAVGTFPTLFRPKGFAGRTSSTLSSSEIEHLFEKLSRSIREYASHEPSACVTDCWQLLQCALAPEATESQVTDIVGLLHPRFSSGLWSTIAPRLLPKVTSSQLRSELTRSPVRSERSTVTEPVPFAPPRLIPSADVDTEWWEERRHVVLGFMKPGSRHSTQLILGSYHEGSSNTNQDPFVAAKLRALGGWLVDRFGEADTPESLDTWMSFFTCAMSATLQRTIEDLITAAQMMVPTHTTRRPASHDLT